MESKPKRSLLSDMGMFLRFWPYARRYKAFIFAAIILMPISTLMTLAQPWLLKQAIDEDLANKDLDGLALTAGLYLGAVLLEYVMRSSQIYSLQYAGYRSVADLRDAVFEHVANLSASFFDRNPTGSLLVRSTNDIEALGESLGTGVVTIISDVILLVGILSAMLLLNVKLTLVSLIAAPLIVVMVNFFRKRLRQAFLAVRKNLSTVNGFLAEHLYGVKVIQLFNRGGRTYDEFKALNFKYLRATQTSNIYDASLYALVDGMSSVAIALMLWYGAGQTVQGAVSAGLLVSFIRYLQKMYEPVKELSAKFAILQQSVAALERILGLLDTPSDLEPGVDSINNPRGDISFDNVTFAYKDGPQVLHGVDFQVQSGEVLALVGATGSGKTTIGKLLARTYGGYKGSILLGGQEVAKAKLEDLRSAVGIVHQDVTLFKGSISFNISLGNPGIDQTKVEEAARLVQADLFIDRLPGGYDFQVTEEGANLSSGQAQLISFARAMAHDPPIIVLDEATASVDSQTEAAIQEAIEVIFERKTVLVIAHRLSTIQKADQILVLANGKVAERGNHESLMAQAGIYADLYARGFSEGGGEAA